MSLWHSLWSASWNLRPALTMKSYVELLLDLNFQIISKKSSSVTSYSLSLLWSDSLRRCSSSLNSTSSFTFSSGGLFSNVLRQYFKVTFLISLLETTSSLVSGFFMACASCAAFLFPVTISFILNILVALPLSAFLTILICSFNLLICLVSSSFASSDSFFRAASSCFFLAFAV